ncbi:MAG: ABC transporter substrate-binding protein, partial [Syntrophomonadaceae bacterium]|nr:ABC transporter substrate-binding protein [Syntrophomonadaceae bacterium]
EVNKVAIPPLPTRLEMLQGGKVQAAILPEPLAGLAVINGAIVLGSTYEMGQKAGAIAFTEQVLQDHPEELQAIFRAYNKAVAYLNIEATDADLDFIIQEQGFPAEIKDSIQLPEYGVATPPDKLVFMDVVKWMQEKDLIKEAYAYQDLVDETVLR